MVALGAVGVISVASNVVPEAVARLVRAATNGDFGAALRAHTALAPLCRALFLESNPIPVKRAMQLAGLLEDASLRLPLVDASPAVSDALLAALQPFLGAARRA
jgi:4-hydroxy-tetrahydrodipicolinate synthase